VDSALNNDNNQYIQVVAAAIFRKNKLLACRRSPGKDLEGFWEFPGGKVEAEETHHNALCREIFEELCLSISVTSLVSKDDDLKKRISLNTYIAETNDTPKLTGAHDKFRWIGFEELFDIKWAPLDSKVADKLSEDQFSYLWGLE